MISNIIWLSVCQGKKGKHQIVLLYCHRDEGCMNILVMIFSSLPTELHLRYANILPISVTHFLYERIVPY